MQFSFQTKALYATLALLWCGCIMSLFSNWLTQGPLIAFIAFLFAGAAMLPAAFGWYFFTEFSPPTRTYDEPSL